jgi:chromate transporter
LRAYLVDRSNWLNDDEFLAALEVSETVPGLIAVNTSLIVGDNLRGVRGAAVAVAGVMLPGTVVMLALGALWEQLRRHPDVTAILLGVAAAAVGMLLSEYIRMGRQQLSQLPDAAIVLATFLSISILRFSTLTVLVTLVPLSVWLYRPKPDRMLRHRGEHLPFYRGPRHGYLRHH